MQSKTNMFCLHLRSILDNFQNHFERINDTRKLTLIKFLIDQSRNPAFFRAEILPHELTYIINLPTCSFYQKLQTFITSCMNSKEDVMPAAQFNTIIFNPIYASRISLPVDHLSLILNRIFSVDVSLSLDLIYEEMIKNVNIVNRRLGDLSLELIRDRYNPVIILLSTTKHGICHLVHQEAKITNNNDHGELLLTPSSLIILFYLDLTEFALDIIAIISTLFYYGRNDQDLVTQVRAFVQLHSHVFDLLRVYILHRLSMIAVNFNEDRGKLMAYATITNSESKISQVCDLLSIDSFSLGMTSQLLIQRQSNEFSEIISSAFVMLVGHQKFHHARRNKDFLLKPTHFKMVEELMVHDMILTNQSHILSSSVKPMVNDALAYVLLGKPELFKSGTVLRINNFSLNLLNMLTEVGTIQLEINEGEEMDENQAREELVRMVNEELTLQNDNDSWLNFC